MEDTRQKWEIDGNEKTIRDGFLTMGKFLFKKKKDYKGAAINYEAAHELHKTILSGYMVLSCAIKNNDGQDIILKALEDAIICCDMSDSEGNLNDESRTRMKRFIKNMDVEPRPLTSNIKKYLDEFEVKLWPWMTK